MKKFVILVFIALLVASCLYVSTKVYAMFNKEEEAIPEKVTIETKKKHQKVLDEKRIISESKDVLEIVGFREKGSKKYSYEDHEFLLKLSVIDKDDSLATAFIKKKINDVKEKINDVGTRKYFQKGYYRVKYGVDNEKNPIQVVSVNEETGEIKVKKPIISQLSFEMPYDKMRIVVEDKTEISKKEFKIKVTEKFTETDRQKFYDQLEKKTQKEFKQDKKLQNEIKEGTEEAIRTLFLKVDKNAKVTFVK